VGAEALDIWLRNEDWGEDQVNFSGKGRV
jgi:hypothetical protein